VAEIRGHLEARGVSRPGIEAAVGFLEDHGYLDDARFAARFAADRRSLDSWGAERIQRRLLELGIARELAASALADVGPDDELQAALELLERRFPESPRDERACRRALGLLVRRGYELEVAHDALRRHRRGVGAVED
jgi:regulatory protein